MELDTFIFAFERNVDKFRMWNDFLDKVPQEEFVDLYSQIDPMRLPIETVQALYEMDGDEKDRFAMLQQGYVR